MTIVTFGDSTTATRGDLRIYSDVLRDELAARVVPYYRYLNEQA